MDGGNYDLPESVRAIAAVIGRRRALELVGAICVPRQKGKGRERRACLYVPHVERVKGSRLEEIAGHDDAVKLAEAFGGEILWLAPAHGVYLRFRNAAIRRMLAQGVRLMDVAFLFAMTDRQIRNIGR